MTPERSSYSHGTRFVPWAFYGTMAEKQLRLYVPEKDEQELLQVQSLKFLLEPHHITPAVLILLSSAAGGITGQNLVVDAGRIAPKP